MTYERRDVLTTSNAASVTDAKQSARLEVVHAVGRWLGPTETWLYNQIAGLPVERVRTRAVADGRHPETPPSFSEVEVSVFADRRAQYWFRSATDRLLRRPHSNPLLADLLREGEIDVVHSHFGPVGWATSRLVPAGGPRQLVTFYGYDVNWLPTRHPEWRERYHDLFRRIDLVLCEGNAMAEAVHRLGCPAEKLRVHHLGVDVTSIEFRPRSNVTGQPRLLMAARFFEKKGLPDGIRAIGRLRDDYPGLSLTVVGSDDGSPESLAERRRIEAAVGDAHLADVVSFRGVVSANELLELGYTHDLFVSPSRVARDGDTEGGAPVSIIEMAACGIPVVSTKHCDIPGVLGEPNRAFLSAEGDIDGLYRQMQGLLEMSDWTSLVVENRRHIERDFDLKRQSEKLADIYAAIAAGDAP
jgi:colanic acid/amylovoran biosynthesis glycosyltransferase